MQTPDFFRARIDAMINLNDPLAVLATRLPWEQIEASVAAKFERQERAGQILEGRDMFGTTKVLVGAGRSNAGRPKLPIRLMASLLYLKHSFNLSDEELVVRWSENVVWQFFSGMAYYEHRLPCDATQIGRFRRDLGEEGLELLLKATIDTAVAIDAIKPKDLERVIVDTTVQEKAIAHPVDSRLLEIARHKVASAAKRAGIQLKQTFAKEGKELRRKAGGYAHAKQFRRLKRVVKRQRTILGVVIREVQRKMQVSDFAPESPKAVSDLMMWIERAERIRAQQRHDKNKLYALHAPEVECIGKGKARKPYEFGVKSAVVVSHEHGLMVGARTFPGNPYDCHILSAVLEQATNLMQDLGVKLKHVVADLGFRGVDADNPDKQIIHRGKFKSLSAQQKGWLRRRQAVEPAIGHLKSDHRMDRCWLSGSMGDALHAISCAAGYNLRWLLRAIARLGIEAVFLRLLFATSSHQRGVGAPCPASGQTMVQRVSDWFAGTTEGGKPILERAVDAKSRRTNFAGPTNSRCFFVSPNAKAQLAPQSVRWGGTPLAAAGPAGKSTGIHVLFGVICISAKMPRSPQSLRIWHAKICQWTQMPPHQHPLSAKP